MVSARATKQLCLTAFTSHFEQRTHGARSDSQFSFWPPQMAQSSQGLVASNLILYAQKGSSLVSMLYRIQIVSVSTAAQYCWCHLYVAFWLPWSPSRIGRVYMSFPNDVMEPTVYDMIGPLVQPRQPSSLTSRVPLVPSHHTSDSPRETLHY